MKHTLSSLAKFANTAGQKKFARLSSKRQHELLAALAWEALENLDYEGFLTRYGELHTWAELDRFTPPSWLTREEALNGFFAFHNAFSPNPLKRDEGEAAPLIWRPAFDVSVLVDQLRSPYNAGSVLRIIDNFGFKEMVVTTTSLSLTHPQLKKSARGCEQWIPVRYEKDPLSWLRNAGVPVIGIEKTDEAVEISQWEPPDRCILIAGNEEHGIAAALRACCTQMVQIPMFGFKKSMNVHHALSIIAQKFTEKKRPQGQSDPKA